MMRLLNKKLAIDFLSQARVAMIVSGLVVLACLASLAFRGLNFGLDFTGGTVVEVRYPAPVDVAEVRSALREAGFAAAQAQHFGTSTEVLVRVPPDATRSSADISSEMLRVLAGVDAGAEMRRVEFVGPQVGDELVEDGGLALLFALIGIFVYVWFRFEWRLSLGAIAATVHDVIVTIGIFSLFQLEFDLTVLASVLAVIGYSVNDTVVVFDRIRENFRRMRSEAALEVMNTAINETLSRTLMTSLTTLLAVLALYIFGGPVLAGFSLALIVGVFVGTYSTIYIATATALHMGLSREDLLPRPKEELDEMP